MVATGAVQYPRHSVFAEMCRISRSFARLSLIEVPSETSVHRLKCQFPSQQLAPRVEGWAGLCLLAATRSCLGAR